MDIDATIKPADSSTAVTVITLNRDHEFFGFTVKAGSFSDGGTIPKPFTLLVDRFGEALPAFILHDDQRRAAGRKEYSYKEADRNLYEYLKELGVNRIRARSIYTATRMEAKARRKKG